MRSKAPRGEGPESSRPWLPALGTALRRGRGRRGPANPSAGGSRPAMRVFVPEVPRTVPGWRGCPVRGSGYAGAQGGHGSAAGVDLCRARGMAALGVNIAALIVWLKGAVAVLGLCFLSL